MSSLMERARRAYRDADTAIARSEVVVSARRLVRDPAAMVKRCAWCGRLLLGRGWVPTEEVPQFVGSALDERTTHGICERCVRRLERDGVSRPLTK